MLAVAGGCWQLLAVWLLPSAMAFQPIKEAFPQKAQPKCRKMSFVSVDFEAMGCYWHMFEAPCLAECLWLRDG